MDFRLTEEQEMIRDMVREFAQEEVAPAAMTYDAYRDPQECVPWDLLKKASGLGLRTAAIPEKWGGEGADYLTLAIILEELGVADQGFATHHPGLLHGVAASDRRAQRRAARRVAAEVHGGRHVPARPRPLRARRRHRLALPLRRARRLHPDLRRARRRRVRHQRDQALHLVRRHRQALLPVRAHRPQGPDLDQPELLPAARRRAGVPHRPLPQQAGPAHCSPTPSSCSRTAASRPATSSAKRARPGAPRASGAARRRTGPRRRWACRRPSACWARRPTSAPSGPCTRRPWTTRGKRIQGGKPIIEHQHVAMKLAELQVQVEAARALLHKACWSFETKYDYNPKIGMLVKAYIDTVGVNAVNIGAGIFGGYGTADDDVPFGKHLRDIYSFLHGFATTEMAFLNGAPTRSRHDPTVTQQHCPTRLRGARMAEQSFVNCTSGGPIRVHVEDGKIVRVRPLVFDDDDAASWSIEVDGKKYTPPRKACVAAFTLTERARVYSDERILYPMKRVDFDPRCPARSGVTRRTAASRATSASAGTRRSTWSPSEMKRIRAEYGPEAITSRASSHHNWGNLGYRSGGLGAVLQPHRLHRHPRQPGQLGRLALGRHARLRFLLAARQPGALRPARGRPAAHRADHPLGQRPGHHARHLRRQRVGANGGCGCGSGASGPDRHRPVLQLHRRARGRQVDRLPAGDDRGAGARHRPRLDHRRHLRPRVRRRADARLRGLPRLRARRGGRRRQDAGLGRRALRRAGAYHHRPGPRLGLPPHLPGRRHQGRRGRRLPPGLRHRERSHARPAAGDAGPGQAGRDASGARPTGRRTTRRSSSPATRRAAST